MTHKSSTQLPFLKEGLLAYCLYVGFLINIEFTVLFCYFLPVEGRGDEGIVTGSVELRAGNNIQVEISQGTTKCFPFDDVDRIESLCSLIAFRALLAT